MGDRALVDIHHWNQKHAGEGTQVYHQIMHVASQYQIEAELALHSGKCTRNGETMERKGVGLSLKCIISEAILDNDLLRIQLPLL